MLPLSTVLTAQTYTVNKSRFKKRRAHLLQISDIYIPLQTLNQNTFNTLNLLLIPSLFEARSQIYPGQLKVLDNDPSLAFYSSSFLHPAAYVAHEISLVHHWLKHWMPPLGQIFLFNKLHTI